MTDVYLDGELISTTNNAEKLRKYVITSRRKGELNEEINVYLDTTKDELRILTDSGRVRRPLIIVDEGKPRITEDHLRKLETGELKFSELAKEGIIEYLDASEEENSYVALNLEDVTREHTHLEMDPAIIHGLSASVVVYPQYNRGDRVNYGSKMCTQGLGMYAKNFHSRFDTNYNILLYAQKPLVSTQSSDKLIGTHPIGQNMIIAIASFEGYNMEDAVIMNKASVERGLGRSFYFRTYTTEARRYWGGQNDTVGIPDKDVRGYRSEEAYQHLPDDGIINPETFANENSVLVGKMSPPKFLGSSEEVKLGLAASRETSTTVRSGESGMVDKVLVSETAGGNKLIKVKLREERIPELGDKFASRHGQKGVIGLIIREEDMPFTRNGIVPDLIFSTHAIPSRMTISHLMELIGSKVAALRGSFVDGTGFHGQSEEDLRKELQELGFRYDGKERMYNGITGELISAMIFIGPMFYLKLEHMVANKIHARSRGPVTLLTKQPTAGRAREGGLRLGEMEKDCFVSHGSALLLKERFGSDFTSTFICQKCGELAVQDKRKKIVYCPICKDRAELVEVKIPQAFILLLDELKTLLISLKIKTEESEL